MSNIRLTLATDADNTEVGDLYIDPNGLIPLTVDGSPEDLAQVMRSQFLFFKGEWFLDQREGMPYYEEILTKNPSLEVIRSIFRQVIRKIPRVLSVPRLSVEGNTTDRELSVGFDVLYDNGDTVIVTVEPFIVEL